MTLRAYAVNVLSVILSVGLSHAFAQQPYLATADLPLRYAAVHGRDALLGGNATAGLEAWCYPLQILRGLKPSFRLIGAASDFLAEPLLQSIQYAPDSIVRIYAGSGFTVRETLFVPKALSGAAITYEEVGREAIEIHLSFVPVLDLMWPVGIGGQEIHWHGEESAYEMDEPTNRFHAVIGSPDILHHDPIANTNAPVQTENRLQVVLRPGKSVRFLMAGSATTLDEAREAYAKLRDRTQELQAEALKERTDWAANTLHIDTPDAEVNKALEWAQLALDQAWVCSSQIGCGLVAGYGPSRGLANRPQYAWFFAGDALTSMPALLLTGNFDRTRDALLFLLKYQDKSSGMMWHEMSQSASYVQWAKDYPYMFPHVDITFQFLEILAEYVRATGDSELLRSNWPAVLNAYKYCGSLIDASDGLPRVPAGKAGGDEQRHPREELTLAVAWMRAADAFAYLADSSGHSEVAPPAHKASTQAASSISSHFWNPATNFWVSGILMDGSPEPEMHLPPPASFPLLDPPQRKTVLERVASSEFQTSWGTRGVGSASSTYDPASYATGSVWAADTAEAALEFWQNDRNDDAWKTWRMLLPWFTLDSMGHLHETLSGSEFRPQIESVPEQTWSSALFLSSFLTGAAGLTPDAKEHRLTFAPQFPEQWDHLALHHVRVGQTTLNLNLTRTSRGQDLAVESNGEPVSINFKMQKHGESHPKQVQFDDHPISMHDGAGSILFELKSDGAVHHLTISY